jgi:hypothetical protein
VKIYRIELDCGSLNTVEMMLYDLEKYYIKKYNTKAPNGYNLTDGGDGIFGCK